MPWDVDIRTATAVEHPCELYAYHSPRVVRTQGHHRHPVYLQNRVYGHIRDAELLWLCGSCHDAVHEWIGFLLGESRRPAPEPGTKAKAEAQRSVDWYRSWAGSSSSVTVRAGGLRGNGAAGP